MAVEDHSDWARQRVARMLRLGGAERVVAVLVSSLDGALSLDGRSSALSSDQDRALLGAWREAADALLVGPATLAAEIYGGGLFAPKARARRIAAGVPEIPPVITVTRSGRLDVDRALRAREPLELIAYVPAQDRVPTDPRVRWIASPDLSLGAVIADVRHRFGHRLIVAEPGPRLLSALRSAWQLTDLSLTLAPVFADQGARLEGAAGLQPLTAVDVETVGGVIFVHLLAAVRTLESHQGAADSSPRPHTPHALD